MNNLVIITGPTAVGKTEISIELAKAINGEIISADSIQVYKYMDIGSAKIKKEEMQGIKHYLIDEFEPDNEFYVNVFQKLTKKYINEIYEKGKTPIIVGGTGFYIQSVLYDIDFDEKEDNHEYRKTLEQIYKDKGVQYLYNMLKEVDEESAKAIHYNNVKRVIRALEYNHQTGKKISDHNKEQREHASPYNFKYFVLNDKRELLYSRINKRVDFMIKEGLVDEVKSLLDKGYDRNLVSMQGIGYKEIIEYLDGKISLDEAVELIKKNTRHFAKRQLTWFRREKTVTMVNWDEYDYDKNKLLACMLKDLREINIIKDK